MFRRINIFRHVRRYQWLLGAVILLVVLFVLAHPPVPKDLNYRYQLDLGLRQYPLVTQTSALVRWSTERVREVYRWNLTAETVARAWPPAKEGTENALLPATILIFIGVGAMVIVWFMPAYRSVGLGLVVFVLAASHLGAHPADYTRFMAWPSTVVPNATVALVTKAEPGRTLGVQDKAQSRLKDMADRYWDHYVQFTRHRMGSAGKLFVGPKRAWFGVSGLVYVLPFAVVLALLAAFTTLVQTILWALCMIAPFGIAIAIADGRAGLKVWDHVIVPLLASLILLAALGLALPLVLFLATLVHATENEVGLLMIGSVFPILVTVAAAVLVRRLRGGTVHARAGLPGLGSATDRTPVLTAPSRTLRSVLSHARRARK